MDRVVGIDVSKAQPDVPDRRLAAGNDEAGIAALVDQLGLAAEHLVVREASGGYSRRVSA